MSACFTVKITIALLCRWALWFFKNDKSKTWQANLRLISKFDAVEDFWGYVFHCHTRYTTALKPAVGDYICSDEIYFTPFFLPDS